MSAAHNELGMTLGHMLMSQLDRNAYRVRVVSGKARRPGATYFIPDVFVVGYGLDWAERYRNLPFVGVVRETKSS